MKNKLFSVLLVTLLTIVFTLSAFAVELAPDGFPVPRVVKDRPIKIGAVYTNRATESVIRNWQQAEIEAAHRGWELVQQEGFNDAGFRDIVQAYVNQNVDAIIINCMPMLALKDLIVKAREKGIGVYNQDSQLVTGVISNVTQPNGVVALELFYKVGEDLKWEGKIAVIGFPAFQVCVERTEPIKAIITAYPTLELVGEEFCEIGGAPERQQAYDFTKRWITKYGKDLKVVVSAWDGGAVGAANAIKASGFDQTQIFSIGIDGGSETWAYLRDKTPFKYSFAQPFELYQHNVFELIDQMQIKGLKPGDEGCVIGRYGETIYEKGRVVSTDSVPDVGSSVHEVFNYYGEDPNDLDAWYNWQEAGGPYNVGTGIK